ncbi:hypothetical protein L6452_21857 [Arctium lappa]|uniref:Uncharacterized protein n=1 Tax=Arctium lappa TaxID=4217 RepID=A0ACB9AZH0_ARCLA|nr:hypothetical protein L6452_21857 [Arctium lappa]
MYILLLISFTTHTISVREEAITHHRSIVFSFLEYMKFLHVFAENNVHLPVNSSVKIISNAKFLLELSESNDYRRYQVNFSAFERPRTQIIQVSQMRRACNLQRPVNLLLLVYIEYFVCVITKNQDVTEAIQKVAAAYDCKIVEGVLSHQLKQFVIDGNKVVLSVSNPETRVDEAEFEENEVYAIDIVTSTGDGKVITDLCCKKRSP